MRYSTLGLVAILLVNITACTNRKELTPKSARSMLQEKLDSEPNRTYVPLAAITALFQKQTTVDYRTNSVTADDLPGLVRRLIDGGFVSVSSQAQTYPDVSGTYTSTVQFVNLPFEYHVSLQSHPGSTAITGTFYTVYSGNRTDGSMTGNAHQDGQVDLTWQFPGNINSTIGPYTYKIDRSDGAEKLNGPSPNWYGVTFSAARNGGPSTASVSVPMYSYAFTSKLETKTINNLAHASVGHLVVTTVDNLLLATDTQATGTFAWKYQYNSFGEAVSQSKQPDRTGHVIFGKQPDGSWVVTEVSM
jgi:hypothetical protein